MIKSLDNGNCPQCRVKVVKIDRDHPNRLFYAVKSMMIDRDNGTVIARCSKCKTELQMPAVLLPRKLKI